jgi:hypothetical protein
MKSSRTASRSASLRLWGSVSSEAHFRYAARRPGSPWRSRNSAKSAVAAAFPGALACPSSSTRAPARSPRVSCWNTCCSSSALPAVAEGEAGPAAVRSEQKNPAQTLTHRRRNFLVRPTMEDNVTLSPRLVSHSSTFQSMQTATWPAIRKAPDTRTAVGCFG